MEFIFSNPSLKSVWTLGPTEFMVKTHSLYTSLGPTRGLTHRSTISTYVRPFVNSLDDELHRLLQPLVVIFIVVFFPHYPCFFCKPQTDRRSPLRWPKDQARYFIAPPIPRPRIKWVLFGHMINCWSSALKTALHCWHRHILMVPRSRPLWCIFTKGIQCLDHVLGRKLIKKVTTLVTWMTHFLLHLLFFSCRILHWNPFCRSCFISIIVLVVLVQ